MAWITCPHCGFTQIPSARCLKCHKSLDRPAAAGAPPPEPASASPTGLLQALKAVPRAYLTIAGALALLVVVAVLLWGRQSAGAIEAVAPQAVATPEPWSFDLTGRWQATASTTIAGSPPRPALREVFLETDRAGAIVGAGVLLTDPGHGGAGAGYLTVPDGGRRVHEIAAALGRAPRGAPLALEFIPFPPWMPRRDRLWRVVEGQRAAAEESTYVLVEALDADYLIQAGVNASGFLSYLFLSTEYASGRGSDALSKAIHPGPDSSLRGFRNLVWDLSGAADFVSLQVPATIGQPAGGQDRLVLKRQPAR
ncbi:MAG TPA: hypothetical protein VGQ33_17335 [Vicinamibacteria bacterium]|nr:hypothetical protein [Vicinamibacteria bacterium]